MDETTQSSQQQTADAMAKPVPPPAAPNMPVVGTEKPAAEQRRAYGTAKTENLRDSGLWRIILPAFVALLCIGLFAVPLMILIPLLLASFSAGSPTHSLTWLWITMIVLEILVAVLIVQGLCRIFMTQAGNYSH